MNLVRLLKTNVVILNLWLETVMFMITMELVSNVFVDSDYLKMMMEAGAVLKMNKEHLSVTNMMKTMTVLNVNGQKITLTSKTSLLVNILEL